MYKKRISGQSNLTDFKYLKKKNCHQDLTEVFEVKCFQAFSQNFIGKPFLI